MSSMTKRISKKMTKAELRFPTEMYNNVVGSLVITNWILTDEDEKPAAIEIKKIWRQVKKKGLATWLDDADFIPKTLAIFKLKPHYGHFVMCQSSSNLLFAPYVNKTVYPIREDGIYAPTIKHGKIYPIEETANVSLEQEERRSASEDQASDSSN